MKQTEVSTSYEWEVYTSRKEICDRVKQIIDKSGLRKINSSNIMASIVLSDWISDVLLEDGDQISIIKITTTVDRESRVIEI